MAVIRIDNGDSYRSLSVENILEKKWQDAALLKKCLSCVAQCEHAHTKMAQPS